MQEAIKIMGGNPKRAERIKHYSVKTCTFNEIQEKRKKKEKEMFKVITLNRNSLHTGLEKYRKLTEFKMGKLG